MPAMRKEEGLVEVGNLVQRFTSGLTYYKSPTFDETSTREMFINPLFEALGWDVRDTRGLGPTREVIAHLRLHTAVSAAGAADWDDDLTAEEVAERLPSVSIPDYSFRLAGQLKFFVEAKKPSASLRRKNPSFQVKSYAWNEQIPIAILTDFEEFRVFDCTLRPAFDEPNKGVIPDLDLRYDDYVENWDILWDTLSRPAVETGSLERLSLASRRRTKGAVRVDESFLRELEQWRGNLARDLASHNASLDRYELAEATQRILDRLIFMRVCEDRGIEPRIVLRRYARLTDSYNRLRDEFRRLDVVYNGQLFAPHFSERLHVRDEIIQHLIENLYFPYSPYRFDVIGPDLLGSIYERFLGKEIEIDAVGAVKVVEKPEVRHAGGVYYTPKWVADYITEATIGRLLAGKTPRAAKNIKVIDPACGSGSFLLSALDYLIRWHESYYSANPNENPEVHRTGADGTRKLTSDAKAEILVNSIFGVDIDPQAVEVTQMSLYLKVLEEETNESLALQRRLLHSFLPPLGKNIRCGNSLIQRGDLPADALFDFDKARRINPFEWNDSEHGFGPVFSERGGFDAVIGNPPYTRVQVLRQLRPEETDAYVAKFHSAKAGSFDIASLFVEQGLKLLRQAREASGRLGYIITRQFAETDAGRPLREILSKNGYLEEVIDFGSGLVFEGTGAYTLIVVASAKRNSKFKLTRVPPPPSAARLAEAQALGSPLSATVSTKTLGPEPWSFVLPEEGALLKRLESNFTALGALVGGTIFQGVITGADYIFVLKDLGPAPSNPGCRLMVRRDVSQSEPAPIEEHLLRPVFAGRSELQPFFAARPENMLILPYARSGASERYALIPPTKMERDYPHAFNWLAKNRDTLISRSGSWTELDWYAFSRRQNLERFEDPKILIPYMIQELCAHLDYERHFFVNVSTGGYGLPVAEVNDPPFLVALLNSKLLSWVLALRSRAWRGGWFAARKKTLFSLPIAQSDVSRRQELVRLYHSCTNFKRQLLAATSDRDRALTRRLFAEAVREFNDTVEVLYDLSTKERHLLRQ